jgi:uncharacterized protein YjbI with pentapeptide repeats
MTKSGNRCEHTVASSDLPDNYGGWTCLREPWEDHDKCIFHAEVENKPADAIGKAINKEPHLKRLDESYLKNTGLENLPPLEEATLINSVFAESTLTDLDLSQTTLSYSNFYQTRLLQVDLSGATFNESNFTNADITSSDLSGGKGRATEFSNARITNVDGQGAQLSDSDFTDGHLASSDFSDAWLHDADFSEVNISSADFTGVQAGYSDFSRTRSVGNPVIFEDADLLETNFEGAELGTVNFRNADIRQSDLSHARLQGSDFSGGSLRRSNLSNAHLQETDLIDCELIRTNFTGAWLNDADMSGSNLHEANLRDTNPNNVSFTDTEMIRTDCRAANMLRCDFSRADLREAIIRRANLTEAIFRDANLWEADLSSAAMERAVFTRANLFFTNLANAHIHGAVFSEAQINEWTRFEGHYEQDIDVPDALGSQEHAESINRTKQEWSYQRIENLYRQNGLPEQARKMYHRRKDLRRRAHREESRILRYTYATLAKFTSNYADSPWRVVASALTIIGVSALLYPAFGLQDGSTGSTLTYATEPLGHWPWMLERSVYVSTVTFTTLGHGDLQPVGLGQTVMTAESLLGVLLMAFLVFVLGRRTTW